MLKRFTNFLVATVLAFGVVALVPVGGPIYAQPPDEVGETPDQVGGEDEDEASDVACEGGSGLGTALAWVLCPIAQLIVDATDFIQRNIIVPFLTVSPLTTDDGNAVYTLWQSIRNIANVLFIIAFFIVIFSQATSIGLSNYGIKRLLPRLAFVAIGTNLSYFIVAFAIDAFNVFGAGIGQLVLAAIPENPTGVDTDAGAGQGIFYTAVGLGILFTPAAGAVLQWLFSLLGIAFLILLVAVIVLVLRQMIILILVILSPLAFVAYLLPNTERYFNKWRNMLIQLLMMYPLIVLLFAVGKIVAALINSGNFTLASGETSGAIADAIKVAMGFFAATVPLIALPATFAFAGGIMGKMYGAIRARGQTGGAALAQKTGNVIKPRAQALQQRLASNQLGANSSRWNPARWVGGAARYKAGYGARKDFKEGQRERELERARQEYIAGHAEGSESFRKSAAGIGGEAGAQRVLASAYATQEKQQKEELDNSMAVLRNVLKQRNIDQKSFAGGDLAKYIQTGADANNRGYREIFGKNPSLMQAALNSAAAQGEVGTIEAARMSSGVDQGMVDRIIRENDGKMKEKGGYHLATNFNLAAGRMPQTNAAGQMVDAGGNVVTNIADAAKVTDQTTMQDVIKRERVTALASSGANSVAGAKAGLLADTAAQLRDHGFIAQMSAGDRENLYQRTQQIVSNPNTLNSTEAPNAIRQMAVTLGLDRHATTPLSAAELANLQQTFNEMDDSSKNQLRNARIIPAGW